MGSFMKQWITDKLGISIPDPEKHDEFQRNASNGFLIAEILRKYGIISDDQLVSLGKGITSSTRLKNMHHISRWMYEAGIQQFSINELLEIAEEKPGFLTKFLYQLYFILESHYEIQTYNRKMSKASGDAKLSGPPTTFLPKDVEEKLYPHKRASIGKELEDVVLGEESDFFSGGRGGPSSPMARFSSAVPEIVLSSADLFTSGTYDGRMIDETEFDIPHVGIEGEMMEPPRSPISSASQCPSVMGHMLLLPSSGAEQQDERPMIIDPIEGFVHERCPHFFSSLANSTLPVKNRTDTAEAVRLYFAKQAAEFLKTQHEEVAIRRLRKKKKEEIAYVVPEDPMKTFLKGIDFAEILKGKGDTNKSMGRKDQETFQEISQFDSKLDSIFEEEEEEALKKKLNKTQEDDEDHQDQQDSVPRGRNMRPIFENLREMQDGLERLKERRRAEHHLSEERVRLRRSLCSKLLLKIPDQIHNDLVNTCLSKTNDIVNSDEQKLADFFKESYKMREEFFDHLTDEQQKLLEIKVGKNYQLLKDKERVEKLKELMHSLEKKRAGLVDEERPKMDEKRVVGMIKENFMEVAIRLAFRIADYRAANDGEDPPSYLIEEWKIFLEGGYDTPPPEPYVEEEEEGDKPLEFVVFDGNCELQIGEMPIPFDLYTGPNLDPEASEELKSEGSHDQRIGDDADKISITSAMSDRSARSPNPKKSGSSLYSDKSTKSGKSKSRRSKKAGKKLKSVSTLSVPDPRTHFNDDKEDDTFSVLSQDLEGFTIQEANRSRRASEDEK